MGSKLAILTSFVVALGIIPGAVVADPDPVCWWKFDGNANDSSSYSCNGTENGGPTYASGYDGQAIVLDGIDDYVVYSFAQQTWSAYTVAVWVRTDTLGQDQYSSVFNNNSSGADFQIDVDGADNYRYRGTATGLFGAVSASWIHLAATCDGSNTTLYYNGKSVGTVAAADTVFGRFAVGVNRNTSNWFAGSVDDVRIYDRALSPAEIQALAPSGEATLLSPVDGAMLGAASVLLEWERGSYAGSVNGHEVFLSDSYDDVEGNAEDAYLDVTSNEFYHVPFLEAGIVYYWRIHEVNDLHPDSPWKSEIWSFTVPETTAWDGFPLDGAKFIDPDVTLEWQIGMGGILNVVYFGTSFADVNTATGGDPNDKTTYDPPGTLANDTVYYWRVDTIKIDSNEVGLVWSFTTRPVMPITEPNLVGYWKMDDVGSGTAVDFSGYDRDGTLRGGARLVPGYSGEAVELDGVDDYVNIDGYKGVVGGRAFSAAAWIKTTRIQQYNTIISWGSSTSGAGFDFRLDSANTSPYSVRTSQGNGNVQGNTPLNDGEWHHVGLTVIDNPTASSSDMRIYVDGEDDTVESSDADTLNINPVADLGIGWRATDSDRSFEGLIDEVRLYDRVLSPAEIRNLGLSLKAGYPSPADGAVLEGTSVMLGWRAGRYAASHNVYFGTDSDSLPLVAKNQPLDSNSLGPVALELGRTYYWSVDEVNDPCAWAGDIWSFETREYLVVDDFDSYVSTSGPNEPSLLSTWKDGGTNGTGSEISLEAEFAGSSMKYAYDNSESPFYSEAELAYDSDEDWTAGGVKAMALEFHGDVGNSGERLYAVLEDADGNSATVTYEGGGLAEETWQVWNIALRDFTDDGVDLKRVKKLVISVFGSGGAGTIYVDDIRLYPPRCLPEYAVASLDGDCITDFGDLDMILRYWLAGDYDVTAAEPNEGHLLAHYRFDETAGLVAYDSSTRGNDAILDPNGGGAWDPCGYDGYCLDFDGTFAVSVPNDVFAAISNEVTISVWVHIDANVNPNSVGRTEFGAGPVEPNEPWDRLAWIQDKPQDDLGRWSHYAFVKDADDGMMRIYYNGVLVAQNVDAFQPIDGAGAGRSTIGSRPDGSGGYEGKLDEFRVYDYALSDAEVLYLARGSGTELHQPLQPVLAPADPYEDGMITFRDFAILGEWWLREALWP